MGADEPESSRDHAVETDAAVSTRLVATAYHEAGHAVMAWMLGRPVQKVTISAGRMLAGSMHIGTRLGACHMGSKRLRSASDALEDEVLILLAGMVGESHWTGDYCQQGAAHDLLAARRLLGQSTDRNDRRLARQEQRLLDKAEHLLAEPAATHAIAMVAAELIAKTTISGRAVQHLLKQANQKYGS